MSKYFNYFPKTQYYLNDDNNSLDYITNLNTTFTFDPSMKQSAILFYEYDISDGETPEMIADKVYGSPEKHWIILGLNNIQHPQFDWPMQQNDLVSYIDKKYRGVSYANTSTSGAGITWSQNNVKSYYKKFKRTDSKGNVTNDIINLDAARYANVSSSSSTVTLNSGDIVTEVVSKYTQTYYEYELEKNEIKRSIKLLKPEFVSRVEQEFRNSVR